MAAPMLLLTLLLSISSAKADDIRYLSTGPQSLASFASAIDSAQKSIELVTFIFEPCDATTQVLMDKLAERAEAGVKVRVVLDGLRQPYDQIRNLAADFSRSGIDLATYSDSIISINLRLHSKYLVIDGREYIAGGRNIADNYFALSDKYNYTDRDVWVEGATAQTAVKSFNSLWNSSMVSGEYGIPADFTPWHQFCENDARAKAEKIRGYLAANSAQLINSAPLRTCGNVKLNIDDAHFSSAQFGGAWDGTQKGMGTFMNSKRLQLKRATAQVQSFIRGTTADLYLENATYLPILGLNDAVTSVRDRGLPIHVVANRDLDEGPEWFQDMVEWAMDKKASQDGHDSQTISLVWSQGSMQDRFELTPPQTPFFVHGKSFIRDGRDVIVGSFNFDSRSANINLESVVTATNCPDLASDVRKGYDQIAGFYSNDLGKTPVRQPPDPILQWLAELFMYQL